MSIDDNGSTSMEVHDVSGHGVSMCRGCFPKLANKCGNVGYVANQNGSVCVDPRLSGNLK